MRSENLRSILVHIIIPFATGVGFGTIFLVGIYSLDVSGVRTLLAATGASVFDLSVFSLVGAFGALAIGTNQAITHYGASFAFVVASVLFALIYLLILADGIYAIVRAW